MKYIIFNTDRNITKNEYNSIIDYLNESKILNIYSSNEIDYQSSLNIKNYLLFGFIIGILISVFFQYYTIYSNPIGLSSKAIFSFTPSVIVIFAFTILSTALSGIIGFIKKSKLLNWNSGSELINQMINTNENYLILLIDSNYQIEKIQDIKNYFKFLTIKILDENN